MHSTEQIRALFDNHPLWWCQPTNEPDSAPVRHTPESPDTVTNTGRACPRPCSSASPRRAGPFPLLRSRRHTRSSGRCTCR